jgi:aryl-alcohol dehydrogenase-like predicted oxidoreductase
MRRQMGSADPSRFPFAADVKICRLLAGMWQVSGGHGRIDPERALRAMREHFGAGFTTFDLADHYGPAEDFVGEFRRRLRAERGEAALAGLQNFTKWVPEPGPMTRSIVEAAIDRSRRRMDVAALDLLQFHWWDYDDPRYLDALRHLADLREAGKIRHLGLTNFDTEHLQIILEKGIPIVSNQVQYSLVDRRPEVAMSEACRRRGVHLLTYGTVAGGLFTERHLGRAEPSRAELTTASLQKYRRMIDVWGGWALFRELLSVLSGIATKHRATIANVAVRAILDRPAVGGVILGVRFGEAEHVAENLRIFDLALDDEDHARIETVTSRSNDLFHAIGDCGDEYRR